MLPNQLNHHSSAHSLHSQPSYGSITSPGGYQPSPSQGPAPGAPVTGHLDNAFRPGPGPVPGLGPIGPGMDMMSNIRDEDVPAMMDRLNLGRAGQPAFGAAPPNFGGRSIQIQTHMRNKFLLCSMTVLVCNVNKLRHDNTQRFAPKEQQAAQAFADRLQQFHDLRVQTDLEQQPNKSSLESKGVTSKSIPSVDSQILYSETTSPEFSEAKSHTPEPTTDELLSLTEQVQKAASTKQSPQAPPVWNKVEPALFPFPPPPSQSPLPAPAAQRKPIVAENLNTETRSGAETPAGETPSASVAPWAKEKCRV